MHPQKKVYFSWFSIFQIRVSLNIFEIELSVSREITIELQVFSQAMEVMFSEAEGHSVYCGVDKFVLLFPACLFDMEFEILTCFKNGSLGLMAPWEGSLTGPDT